jgi:hypothetical protein
LKDRDEFEDAIENNNITAKQVDGEGFDERTKESNDNPEVASWNTIQLSTSDPNWDFSD